eukprot:2806303-Alexandrium_andersonii.AAC.1
MCIRDSLLKRSAEARKRSAADTIFHRWWRWEGRKPRRLLPIGPGVEDRQPGFGCTAGDPEARMPRPPIQ